MLLLFFYRVISTRLQQCGTDSRKKIISFIYPLAQQIQPKKKANKTKTPDIYRSFVMVAKLLKMESLCFMYFSAVSSVRNCYWQKVYYKSTWHRNNVYAVPILIPMKLKTLMGIPGKSFPHFHLFVILKQLCTAMGFLRYITSIATYQRFRINKCGIFPSFPLCRQHLKQTIYIIYKHTTDRSM